MLMIVLLCRIPLIVEVWQRDEQLSQNNCLGVAHIDLSTVIKVQKAKAVVRTKLRQFEICHIFSFSYYKII